MKFLTKVNPQTIKRPLHTLFELHKGLGGQGLEMMCLQVHFRAKSLPVEAFVDCVDRRDKLLTGEPASPSPPKIHLWSQLKTCIEGITALLLAQQQSVLELALKQVSQTHLSQIHIVSFWWTPVSVRLNISGGNLHLSYKFLWVNCPTLRQLKLFKFNKLGKKFTCPTNFM